MASWIMPVEKLWKDNYDNWNMQMEAILIKPKPNISAKA